MVEPFLPLLSDTAKQTATTSSAATALTVPGEGGVAATPGARTARVYNAGLVAVFIQFGDSSVVATVAKMPIPPGAVEVFTIAGATYFAAITASSTADVYVTPGRGA